MFKLEVYSSRSLHAIPPLAASGAERAGGEEQLDRARVELHLIYLLWYAAPFGRIGILWVRGLLRTRARMRAKAA